MPTMSTQITLFIENDSGTLEFNTTRQSPYELIVHHFNEKNLTKLENIAHDILRSSSSLSEESISLLDKTLACIPKLADKENASSLTVDILTKALKSHSNAVNILAIRALGRIGDPAAVTPIMESYRKNKGHVGYNAIRIAAIETMGNLKDKKAVPLLTHALHGGAFEAHRALTSLAQVGIYQLFPSWNISSPEMITGTKYGPLIPSENQRNK